MGSHFLMSVFIGVPTRTFKGIETKGKRFTVSSESFINKSVKHKMAPM